MSEGAPEPTYTLERFLHLRGVEDPCEKCHGMGQRAYGSTATWRGGIGGQMITSDVCDACWGSGDRFRTGCDLRRLRAEEEKRVAEHAVDLLARSMGASLANCRPAIAHVIEALDKISNKRGAPAAPYLPELSQALANTLRRAIGAQEVRRWK